MAGGSYNFLKKKKFRMEKNGKAHVLPLCMADDDTGPLVAASAAIGFCKLCFLSRSAG